MRPPDHKYDKAQIRSCAIKPINQEIKIDVGLNINSVNFDVSKAEEIAINADGASGYRDSENGVMFDNNLMDKQCFTSCKAVEDCSKYAVGVVHADEIHITPLKGTTPFELSVDVVKCKQTKKIQDEFRTFLLSRISSKNSMFIFCLYLVR